MASGRRNKIFETAIIACNCYKKNQELFLEDDNDDDFLYENEIDGIEEEDLCFEYFSDRYKKRKIQKITGYVDKVVVGYTELEFRQNFRLKRSSFEIILHHINLVIVTHETGRHLFNVEKQLYAVIWLLATPDSYRSVAERFNITKSTLSRAFVRIVNAINTLCSRYIKWPIGEEVERSKRQFNSSSFPGVIGAIDGTYVSCTVPASQSKSYTNRKCFTSITLQAICDADLKYLDCYVGWPSSVPDVRIFKNSPIYEKAGSNMISYFPNGEYILGDKAYPALNWCIPPFIERSRLTQQQKLFNKNHASTRQVVERSFALLFGRFRRLKHLDMKRIDWIPATIMACCVLHNVCLMEPDDNIDEYIIEGSIVQVENSTTNDEGRNAGNTDGYAKRQQICNNLRNI